METIVMTGGKFKIGDRVRKIKGSSWQGKVCSFYATQMTPIGYCVESEREPGSVQIYPESALEIVNSSQPKPTGLTGFVSMGKPMKVVKK